MKFRYQAFDQKGGLREGELEALDAAEAQEILRERGLWPVELRPASRLSFRFERGVASGELVLFTSQLARLLRAGLPLDRALRVLRRIFESAGKERLVVVIEAVTRELESGEDLARALSRHRLFPDYYVNLVRAGQAAGALPAVLESLADYLVKQQSFRRQLVSTTLYPAFLLVFGLFAVQTVLVYVLPRFGRIFDDLGVEPPAFTRFLIELGLFWRDWGPVVLIGAAGLFLLLRRHFSSPEGRRRLEDTLMRVPLVGRSILLADLARVFRGLAVMLSGGVPVEKALVLSADIPVLHRLRKLLQRATEDIKHGRPLSSSFRDLPPSLSFVADLLAVGEETGDLARAFAEVASLAEDEVQSATRRFLTVLEPAAILFFGAVLGTIIVSIMLAIFDLRV